MKSTYTEAFVEQALLKLFSRDDRTIRSVAGHKFRGKVAVECGAMYWQNVVAEL